MNLWPQTFFKKLESIGLQKFDKTKWPLVEPRFIQLANLMAMFGAGISFLQCILEFLGGTTFYAISDLVGGALLLCTFGLNALGRFSLARVFVLLILNLDIYYFNLVSNFSASLESLYFMFMLFPFFIFSTREKFLLILTSLIPVALYCVNRFYSQFNFLPQEYILPAPTWYAMAVPFVTFGVTFGVVFRFLKINEEMQVKVLHNSKFSALGEMAAGISHEINNPLAAIILATQIAKREAQKQEDYSQNILEKLERIERASYRASDIIQALKVFARESKRDPFTTVDLKLCIEQTLLMCQQRFLSGGVDFELILNATPKVNGNATQISQILINLLNNAFDAIQDVESKWIRLELSQQGSWAVIRVSDSGPGVPKKIQTKIMEPFFTTKAVGQGTGLGLSIAKGIAEVHLGELYLDVNAKQSSFVLRLPLAK